jgi:DNA helicase-2/ATP-dependent DNA helicase PcrA
VNLREAQLSPEQLAALAPDIQLIEAGPGAGKTRTVVERLRQRVSEGRHVALLSFTNAAVNVAKERCREKPTLAEPPNFVGTFDQFFHRYVLTPDVRMRFGISPRYVNSWDDLGGHLAVVRPPNGGVGIPLSRFALHNGTWVVDEARLSRKQRLWWEQITQWSRNHVCETAGKRITGLHAAHVYDTAESRARALAALRTDTRYMTRLSHRFGEVIVDEFQDCDAVEYQLLDLLGEAGIQVVAVADPDQAIYEFRQATPGSYEQRRSRVPDYAVAPLTTCYRSAPPICALISSLRSVGIGAVRPNLEHDGGADVVHVVVGSGVRAGATAVEIIRSYGIADHDMRVIAHRRTAARALVGQGGQLPDGVSQMESLLVPLADLRSSTDPQERRAAAKRVERFVLDQFAWPHEADLETTDGLLERLETPPEHLRVITGRLLSASHNWPTAKACSVGVRAVLEEFASERPVDLHARIGTRLKAPPEKVWTFWESRVKSTSTAADLGAIPWAHVHGVKGNEFDGVVLAIPSSSSNPTHVLDDWENGLNTEQRRVLYVGASRAAKVLVLVVRKGQRSTQLRRILAQFTIPHAIMTIK